MQHQRADAKRTQRGNAAPGLVLMMMSTSLLLVSGSFLFSSTMRSRQLIAEHQALQVQLLDAFVKKHECQALVVPGTSYTVYHCAKLPDRAV
ncbi:hypothetical protein ACOTC5_31280 [Achromobacter xylosoxidans]|uniref:hypothetical protein n=1 Tax=Achromobacter anxifer TaxID=1287737 RepID=UPI00159032F5|nr:hypothetical protein [Achromobacter anxifer]